MPIFLFSITEDPFPLVVLAIIQLKVWEASELFNALISSSILCPSTSFVSIPKPSIFSLIG